MTLNDIRILSTEELHKLREDWWALGNIKWAGLVDREIRFREATEETKPPSPLVAE